jgi:hypothetical protein
MIRACKKTRFIDESIFQAMGGHTALTQEIASVIRNLSQQAGY